MINNVTIIIIKEVLAYELSYKLYDAIIVHNVGKIIVILYKKSFKSLSESEKELLLSRLDPQVRIVVARFRSQKRNKDLAVEKLMSIVDANLKTNAKRVPTKPSVSVKRKRVEKKRKRGELKRQRRPIDFID